MTNDTDGNKRSVSSLGELSRDVAPPRDLWPSIAAQISTNASSANAAGERRRLRPTGMQWAALAAVVSALAVGIWLGRTLSVDQDALNRRAAQNQSQSQSERVAQSETPPSRTAQSETSPSRPATEGLPGGSQIAAADPNSFVTDPRYTMQRAALIRGLEDQLKTLPPDTQHKVAASLATIRTSIKDLQDALGRDPANELLQELLVNSYQDEMRVLTAVREAGGASGGI